VMHGPININTFVVGPRKGSDTPMCGQV
jgi:hypothetical protein